MATIRAQKTGDGCRFPDSHWYTTALFAAPMRAAELSLGEPSSYAVTEHLALMLGLLFRTLAPMRSRANMIRVAEGIEAMGQEEAAYWLGMAMHRANPRRVLSALRTLLTDPARQALEER